MIIFQKNLPQKHGRGHVEGIGHRHGCHHHGWRCLGRHCRGRRYPCPEVEREKKPDKY